MKCISRNEPAPATIVQWCTKRAGYLSETDQHAFPLINIISHFVNLYSAIKKGFYLDDETVYEELLDLEANLELWEVELPEAWKFTLEAIPEDAGETTFNRQRHIYRDLW